MIFGLFFLIIFSCYVVHSTISAESKTSYYMVLTVVTVMVVLLNVILN